MTGWRVRAAASCAMDGADHDIWTSPLTATPFTVPVNIGSRHTDNKIFKDAGLLKAF